MWLPGKYNSKMRRSDQLQTVSLNSETRYYEIGPFVLGCEHKRLYPGMAFNGLCYDCEQYPNDLNSRAKE